MIKRTAKYEIYGIAVSEFSLPPANGDITVTKFDKLGPTVRLFVEIRGKKFRRLQDRLYPVVWAEGEIGNILSEDKTKDLEDIFKAYLEEVNNKKIKCIT